MFTLVAWSHCYNRVSGELTSWNPVNAAELAIPGRLGIDQKANLLPVSTGRKLSLEALALIGHLKKDL